MDLNDNMSLETLINDVIALAKSEAIGKPPTIRLSQETAALLLAVGEPGTVPPQPATTETVDAAPHAIATSPAAARPEEEQEMKPAALPATSSSEILKDIAAEVTQCEKCPLGAQRQNAVPGEGNAHASLVFVGEAPGASEDRQGRPFVGRAGGLLTDIIVKGMEIKREDVFICNVLKCRPPGNRTPNPEEVTQCEPYLLRQLEAIGPKVICALGATAAQTLLKTTEPIKRLRGAWHNYHGIPFRVTYHPAYLLRNPVDKKKTWEDIQEVMRALSGEITPEI